MQYRETDFNFVSRLMEEEGIYYYFKHTDGHNTMVIADSLQRALGRSRTTRSSPYIPLGQGRSPRAGVRQRAGSIAQRGPAGRATRSTTTTSRRRASSSPSSRQLAAQPRPVRVRGVRLSRASTCKTADGEQLRAHAPRGAAVRSASSAQRQTQRAGRRAWAPRSSWTRQPRADQNREYLVVSADYELELHRVRGDGDAGRDLPAARSPRCDSKQPFRPQRTDAQADRPGPADRGRRRPDGRGDLHRQVRPREGAVPLGPLRQDATRTARAGSASRSRGRARTGAWSPSRASARR